MILKCIRTVAIAALAFVSVNVSGQDLLARQAPIDRKLKAVDSLALIRQIKAEQAVYPAYSLYPNWNNQRVHAYGNTVQIPIGIKTVSINCFVISTIYFITVVFVIATITKYFQEFIYYILFSLTILAIIFVVAGLGIKILNEIYKKAIEYKEENDFTI